MQAFEVDYSNYPILTVTITQELTVALVNEEFDRIEHEISELSGPFVMITVTSGRFVSGETRVAIGKRSNSFLELFKARHLASIIVIQSPIARMMAKGAMLLVRSKQRVHLVESLDKAKALAQEKLELAAIAP